MKKKSSHKKGIAREVSVNSVVAANEESILQCLQDPQLLTGPVRR